MKALDGTSLRNSLLTGLMAGLGLLAAGAFAQSQPVGYPKANVDFGDFKQLVADVEVHRKARLIDLDTFLEMSREADTIILDARSKARFDRLHVGGAKHLNFSDFTQQSLSQVIPTLKTTVLIYCNNNFEGNEEDFPTKVALPVTRLPATGSPGPGGQRGGEQGPLMMALNIPTYINLYGYGYRNVYELNELVSVDDPRVRFSGLTASSTESGAE